MKVPYSCLFSPLTQVVFLASLLKEHVVSQLLTIPQRSRRGIGVRKKGSAVHQITLIISVNVSHWQNRISEATEELQSGHKAPITPLSLIFTLFCFCVNSTLLKIMIPKRGFCSDAIEDPSGVPQRTINWTVLKRAIFFLRVIIWRTFLHYKDPFCAMKRWMFFIKP